MYVHIWTCIHTHMSIPGTLQTHSQWSARCSRDIIGTAYLAFYRKKKGASYLSKYPKKADMKLKSK